MIFPGTMVTLPKTEFVGSVLHRNTNRRAIRPHTHAAEKIFQRAQDFAWATLGAEQLRGVFPDELADALGDGVISDHARRIRRTGAL